MLRGGIVLADFGGEGLGCLFGLDASEPRVRFLVDVIGIIGVSGSMPIALSRK